MSTNTIRQITTAQLKAELDAGQDLFILDLRTADEVAQWQVQGRKPVPTINTPYFDFLEDEAAAMAQLPRVQEITLICAKGGASAYIAEILEQNGFRARNVEGGMQEWAVLYDPKTVVETENFSLIQFNRIAKGCLSYVMVSGDEALIVDPGRHVEPYLAATVGRGLKVAGVVDTHVHADHISGGHEIAAKSGAPYYIADDDMEGAPLPYIRLDDGDVLKVGSSTVRVLALATPGHTPGSSSLLIDDRYFLSGDTLFVESVGRPDLGGMAKDWAYDLFDTLYAKLGDVKDDVLVLPAHYSRPEEIRAGGLVAEKLGKIRAENEAFHVNDKEQFVAYILGDLPEQPASYAVMRLVNRGEAKADEERAFELEIGANRCAAKHGH